MSGNVKRKAAVHVNKEHIYLFRKHIVTLFSDKFKMGQVNAKSDSKRNPSHENIILTENVRQRLQNLSSSSSNESQKAREPQLQKQTEPETVVVDSPGPALADQESQLTHNKNYWKRRLEELQESQEKIKEVTSKKLVHKQFSTRYFQLLKKIFQLFCSVVVRVQ